MTLQSAKVCFEELFLPQTLTVKMPPPSSGNYQIRKIVRERFSDRGTKCNEFYV